jgi:hypothetical protein
MKTRRALFLRLTALPAVTALAVLILASLSILDLTWGRRSAVEEGDRQLQKRFEEPPRKDLVPLTANVPLISEAEALAALRERPTRNAVKRLWAMDGHREALFRALLSRETPEDVRLYLMGAFDEAIPKKAVEAARVIVKDKDLPESPLVFSAYDVLSRHGGKDDLVLFTERENESYQLKTIREEYRDQAQGQAH